MSFIPVNEPLLNGNEKKYLIEAVDTGWISSEGTFVKQFEEKFSNYCEQKFGTAVANGTAALEIALRALKDEYKFQDGDEIIIPSFTIISCLQAITLQNLKPIFVDASEYDWNIDIDLIESHITKKTKAIMAVHIYGLPCDMDKIVEIAKKHNLKIIEDAAQSHGQKYFSTKQNRKIKCGAFGDVSTFSFYSNKHITTGEGGMVMTSNENLDKRIKSLRNLCFGKDRFIHEELGWNYRMTNIQAAIGLAQFEQLEHFISLKKEMGKFYKEELSNLPIKIAPQKTNYAENNYWVFGILLDDSVKFNAKTAMEKLSSLEIGTRPFFYPLHKQPVVKKMGLNDEITRPISEMLYERGFYIPSGLNLTKEKMSIVVEKVKKIFK